MYNIRCIFIPVKNEKTLGSPFLADVADITPSMDLEAVRFALHALASFQAQIVPGRHDNWPLEDFARHLKRRRTQGSGFDEWAWFNVSLVDQLTSRRCMMGKDLSTETSNGITSQKRPAEPPNQELTPQAYS